MIADWVGVVEAAYRLEPEPADWLSALADRMAALVPGAGGAMVYIFDARKPESEGVRLGAWSSTNVPPAFVQATLELNRRAPWEESARVYGGGILCGTVSELTDTEGQSLADGRSFARAVKSRGFRDTFGVTASAPGRRGLVVNAPLEHPLTLHPATRQRWRELGVHLQAAYRLRQRMGLACERGAGASSGPTCAVVAPGGEVFHAEGDARAVSARAELGRAARRIHEARRASVRSEPAEALALWRGLVDGRWSLVERFDSDGRRFFVAIENAHDVSDPRSLTKRERAVVALVAQGDSNKWVAYQLGITAGAVATLLARAMRKLGLETRAALIWTYQHLAAADGGGA